MHTCLKDSPSSFIAAKHSYLYTVTIIRAQSRRLGNTVTAYPLTRLTGTPECCKIAYCDILTETGFSKRYTLYFSGSPHGFAKSRLALVYK